MRSRRKMLGYAAAFAVVGIIIFVVWLISTGFFTPNYGTRQIVMDEWDLSTDVGATIYKGTAYGYPSLIFNVTSSAGSEAYMLARSNSEFSLKSISLIRTSDTSCRIDWGWLGFGENYAFLIWNGTHWIANTDNGSRNPEVTVISGYAPSANWRELRIEASVTEVKYYLDSDLVATHVNRIPSGTFQFYGELKSSNVATQLYIASHH